MKAPFCISEADRGTIFHLDIVDAGRNAAEDAGGRAGKMKSISCRWSACVTSTPPSSVAHFPRQAAQYSGLRSQKVSTEPI